MTVSKPIIHMDNEHTEVESKKGKKIGRNQDCPCGSEKNTNIVVVKLNLLDHSE